MPWRAAVVSINSGSNGDRGVSWARRVSHPRVHAIRSRAVVASPVSIPSRYAWGRAVVPGAVCISSWARSWARHPLAIGAVSGWSSLHASVTRSWRCRVRAIRVTGSDRSSILIWVWHISRTMVHTILRIGLVGWGG